MKHPKLSIGMPIYNAERYLREALNSIVSQTFEDFELIISDNASTDGSQEICREYVAKDERIHYFRNRMNFGVPYNFGQTFRLSSGRYFKWAAADDICGKDYLMRAVDALDADSSIVLAWGRTEGINVDGERIELPYELYDLNSAISVYSPDPVIRWRRLMRNIWWVDGPFYGVIRSETLAKVPVLRNHYSSDHFLLADLILHGRFFEIPETLFFNRVHPGKTSRVKTRKERAVLLEMDPKRRQRFKRLKVVKHYVERPLFYLDSIRVAPISPTQKAQCATEVIQAGIRWLRRPGRGGY
jgi:glycosyltransferase involved in cell wall biosynthesis